MVLACKLGKVAGFARASTGSLHGGIKRGRARHGLVGGRQENDLAVRRLGHGLHRLEVTDLHGGRRRQNVGCLAHELGGFDFRLGGNNLRLSQPLALGSHGQRLLQLLAENNVLDEHALHLDTPAGSNIFNNLANRLGQLLAALNDVLQNTSTDNVTQSGLGALNQSLADIGDAESGLMGADNMVVDDRGQVDGNIVLGHADLLGDLDDLDLDIDLDQAFAQRVNLHQAGVDCLVKSAKFGDETDVALINALVRVGAANAAGNGTDGADTGAKTVDCACVLVPKDGGWVGDRRKL